MQVDGIVTVGCAIFGAKQNLSESELQQMSPKPPGLRGSATVLLLREGNSRVEILLTRRHANMNFMAGLWVYPGGTLDPADTSSQALSRISKTARNHCAGILSRGAMRGFSTEHALGMFVAACRETFEEVGILLANDAGGRACEASLVARLQTRRKVILEFPAAFSQMLVDEDLVIDASAMVYWAHWITPSAAPKRFDTHFFIIPAPEGQPVCIDTSEATEWKWLDPAAALSAHARDELPLSPPTVLTLQEVRDSFMAHGSLRGMLESETRREVATIIPKAISGVQGNYTLMPWHPDYQAAPGEGVAPESSFPEHLRRLPGRVNRKHDFSGKPVP